MSTGTKLHCCETCGVYWTCETKWYRGERGDENLCCPVCGYYQACLEKASKDPGAPRPNTPKK